MGFDVVLMVVVLAGVALSAAYVRAEYIGWREDGSAERHRESALRELHAARLSAPGVLAQDARLLPNVVQLRGFSPEYTANTEEAANADPHRSYPSVERRKRSRQQVSR
ncbi:MAG: hypothetical protein M3O26_15120 [Pseudomonadota bacterium]|nr:hypothetical protein [Pseudomonadota bacterium]